MLKIMPAVYRILTSLQLKLIKRSHSVSDEGSNILEYEAM
jgi:hypothetical protein